MIHCCLLVRAAELNCSGVNLYVWRAAAAARCTDLSMNMLQAALRPLERDLTCELCAFALRDRIAVLITDWSAVKVRRPLALVDS